MKASALVKARMNSVSGNLMALMDPRTKKSLAIQASSRISS